MPVFGLSSVEPRFSSASVLVIEQSRKKSRPTSCMYCRYFVLWVKSDRYDCICTKHSRSG